ncbi:Uncharacterized small protein, DUF1192 family [Rhizobium sp. RU20A]|uniref:DUF1192 domain-containing protein n=1 Tax=Rhizobium sp. RU20A TaxID=1907412 RepID=UPI00095517E6|nr:DUF1192 domain-containing protein [Rhizobium sp. RU20A]SIQ38586.1 Uncharacterized small protein, DUF1192 family [Rhizobium sp. RU20A]
MGLFDEEATKPKRPGHEIGADLSLISADELQERIGLLKAEIERLEAEMAKKRASRSAAEGLFR